MNAQMISSMVVLIPTHGRPDLLERTLQSMAGCTLPSTLRAVRIVENGGQHGAEACVKSFANVLPVEYQYFPRGNKSAALNHAMSDLHDELVVFFDDDVRLAPDILVAYAACLALDGDGLFFGGPFGCDYDAAPPDWLKGYLPVSARGWASPDGRGFAKDLAFIGFNWAAFAKDIKALGGFDPRVGPGGESGASGQESNMQVRLQDAGFRPRYIPDAMVWHYVPESRCSPDWAIGRIRRQGSYLGLHATGEHGSIFGLPPWVVRRLVQRTGIFLRTRLSSDPATRFRARFSLAETWGEIRGRVQRRRSEKARLAQAGEPSRTA